MKDIQENNRLIAQFMGFTIEKNLGYYDNEMLMGQNVYDQQNGNCFDELLFNTSWDWLMPVVEKIREEGAEISISYRQGIHPTGCYTYCRLNKSTFSNSWGVHKNAKGNRTMTMKEAVYNSVVEFIKWYNENKED